MSDGDPHIHVDKKLRSDLATRDTLARTFGLVPDVPTTVTTGCGMRVPVDMTSVQPEKVTCLPCRTYAHRQHLRLAEQIEGLGTVPGSPLPHEQASQAATRLRELARRFT